MLGGLRTFVGRNSVRGVFSSARFSSEETRAKVAAHQPEPDTTIFDKIISKEIPA